MICAAIFTWIFLLYPILIHIGALDSRRNSFRHKSYRFDVDMHTLIDLGVFSVTQVLTNAIYGHIQNRFHLFHFDIRSMVGAKQFQFVHTYEYNRWKWNKKKTAPAPRTLRCHSGDGWSASNGSCRISMCEREHFPVHVTSLYYAVRLFELLKLYFIKHILVLLCSVTVPKDGRTAISYLSCFSYSILVGLSILFFSLSFFFRCAVCYCWLFWKTASSIWQTHFARIERSQKNIPFDFRQWSGISFNWIWTLVPQLLRIHTFSRGSSITSHRLWLTG